MKTYSYRGVEISDECHAKWRPRRLANSECYHGHAIFRVFPRVGIPYKLLVPIPPATDPPDKPQRKTYTRNPKAKPNEPKDKLKVRKKKEVRLQPQEQEHEHQHQHPHLGDESIRGREITMIDPTPQLIHHPQPEEELHNTFEYNHNQHRQENPCYSNNITVHNNSQAQQQEEQGFFSHSMPMNNQEYYTMPYPSQPQQQYDPNTMVVPYPSQYVQQYYSNNILMTHPPESQSQDGYPYNQASMQQYYDRMNQPSEQRSDNFLKFPVDLDNLEQTKPNYSVTRFMQRDDDLDDMDTSAFIDELYQGVTRKDVEFDPLDQSQLSTSLSTFIPSQYQHQHQHQHYGQYQSQPQFQQPQHQQYEQYLVQQAQHPYRSPQLPFPFQTITNKTNLHGEQSQAHAMAPPTQTKLPCSLPLEEPSKVKVKGRGRAGDGGGKGRGGKGRGGRGRGRKVVLEELKPVEDGTKSGKFREKRVKPKPKIGEDDNQLLRKKSKKSAMDIFWDGNTYSDSMQVPSQSVNPSVADTSRADSNAFLRSQSVCPQRNSSGVDSILHEIPSCSQDTRGGVSNFDSVNQGANSNLRQTRSMSRASRDIDDTEVESRPVPSSFSNIDENDDDNDDDYNPW